ncbi:hypothetical protein SRABI134_02185 [Peribacillus sp. Bi134]|nr:hypothetical protein SRABI134_02185 [Peribacillus sp. Bi134]
MYFLISVYVEKGNLFSYVELYFIEVKQTS